MNTLRKINMIAAPPLWFGGLFLIGELAFGNPWLGWLRPYDYLIAVLWYLTHVTWFLGVVDIIYHLFHWRTVRLRWFIPACIVNILGLTVYFTQGGYVYLLGLFQYILSKLG